MAPLSRNNPFGDLLTELDSHNEFFDDLVNMIPARLYVAGHSGDDAYHPKYLKGQHKESKEARRARNKLAKKEKFDPERVETTLETKKRLRDESESEDEMPIEHAGDDDDDDDIDDGGGDESSGDKENRIKASSTSDTRQMRQKEDNPSPAKSYESRIEILRAKLRAKMAEKRAASGLPAASMDPDSTGAAINTSAPTIVSKRAARRAEKRKRQALGKKKALTPSLDPRNNAKPLHLGGSVLNAGNAKSSRPQNQSSQNTPAQDLATIDYQPLAGLKPKADSLLDNKSLNPKLRKKKSLEHLLAEAEKKQQRLKELKQSLVEEDREKAKNIEWADALKVASGSNSRKTNDPKLIKNAMKRKAKKKAASTKAWNARLDQAKEAAKKRQQIRTHNLDKRKQGGTVGANLSSKRIVDGDTDETKAEKDGETVNKRRRLGPHSQGRNRPGFEGKKQGFININSPGNKTKDKQ